MKKIIKKILVSIFGWQVRRLRANNNFKIVAVVGSMGKTSTKFAIAHVLSGGRRVRWQKGNYNDQLSVPLVFFGHAMPNILNPFAWLSIFIKNEINLRRAYPFDVVVIELGTDGPGQIAEFKQYLGIDMAVLTSVAPEHMEFFENIDSVATEELSVIAFSRKLVVNSDLVESKYLKEIDIPITTVGSANADFKIDIVKLGSSAAIKLQIGSSGWLELSGSFYSKAEVYSISLAAVIADLVGLHESEIKEAVQKLTPVSGRMHRLKGYNESLIIDDTYNASPDATIAALEVLYAEKSPQKIALLGNMNELGTFSEAEHTRVGHFCDPAQLDFVATLGPDSNTYLAAAAEKQGCKVKRFESPYELGEYIKKLVKKEAVILAKGSQNNVYMEEAVKILLANPSDAGKLVRQSKQWHKIKKRNFNRG